MTLTISENTESQTFAIRQNLAQAAAEAGKAFQARARLFDAYVPKQEDLLFEKSDKGKSSVLLLKEIRVLLKKSPDFRSSEEDLVFALGQILCPGAVVPLHSHKTALALKRQRDYLSEKKKDWGFSAGELQKDANLLYSLNGKVLKGIPERYLKGLQSETPIPFPDAFYLLPKLSEKEWDTLPFLSSLSNSRSKGLRDQLKNSLKTNHLENSILEKLVHGEWELFEQRILQSQESLLTYGPMYGENVRVKVLLPHLLTLNQFPQNGRKRILEHFYSHMTPQSYRQMILSLYLQMMDLHDANIGFTPSDEDGWESFLASDYYINEEHEKPLGKNLFWMYLKKEWHPGINQLWKKKDTYRVPVPIEEQEKLMKTFHQKWNLQLFFDTDCSMAETNLLIQGTQGSHVALRNHLLRSSIKDEPLPDFLVEELLSPEWEQKLQLAYEWMRYDHAPLKLRFGKKFTRQINEILEKELSSAIYGRKGNKNGKSLKKIKTDWVYEKLKDKQNPLWLFLERYLGPLKTSERRKWAFQLFPKASLPQQKAYLQRVEKIRCYLQHYRDLEKSSSCRKEELKKFIEAPYTPLSESERRKWTKKIQHMSLFRIRSEFLQLYRPTFSNCAKVMYPLLADYMHLLKALGIQDLGLYIGHPKNPIEKMIEKAKNLPAFLPVQKVLEDWEEKKALLMVS